MIEFFVTLVIFQLLFSINHYLDWKKSFASVDSYTSSFAMGLFGFTSFPLAALHERHPIPRFPTV